MLTRRTATAFLVASALSCLASLAQSRNHKPSEMLCCMCDCGMAMAACPTRVCRLPSSQAQCAIDATNRECMTACLAPRPLTLAEMFYMEPLGALIDLKRIEVFATGPQRETWGLTFRSHPYQIFVDRAAAPSVKAHEVVHSIQYLHNLPESEAQAEKAERLWRRNDVLGMHKFVEQLAVQVKNSR